MSSRHWIIAIDGPAGSGKSTVAKRLAAKLRFRYVDTGAMYRAFALHYLRERGKGGDPDVKRLLASVEIRCQPDKEGSVRTFLNGEDVSEEIRRPDVTEWSSRLSGLREVREALTALQRREATKRNIVVEGRDMGTVVFPEAAVKFYLTADPAVRAHRRYLERKGTGETVAEEEVRKELEERDRRDTRRKEAPLKPAAGAVVIDSSKRTIEQVVEEMLSIVKKRIPLGSLTFFELSNKV